MLNAMAGVRVLLYLCASVACINAFLDESGQIFGCDFETDECGLENTALGTYSVSWQRHQGSLDRTSTGPRWDHTLGNAAGHFMYVEFDDQHYQYSTLKSTTTYTNNEDGQCLTFWYNMYDRDDKKDRTTLQVVSSNTAYVIWSASSAQERDWMQATVPLHEKYPFKIYLSAERKDSYQGGVTYLAVDDIVVHDGSCASISPASRPDAIVSCDFEGGLCTWQTSQWERKTGHTGLIPGDYTENGDGYYLYTEKDDKNYLYLSSEEILPKKHKQCMVFHYMLFGAELRLSKRNYYRTDELWSSTGSRGSGWNRAELTISSSDKYWLEFELKTANYNRAALDDIQIYEGDCGSSQIAFLF